MLVSQLIQICSLVCWKATSICLQGICWLDEFTFNLDKLAGIVGKVTWGYGLL